MSYFLQLKMLLWKNLLIRKRQKFRCIVEVIWPLFLFLILMWVRTKDLREDIHECHFVQKAMPTAGALPFLQSFFCTANNTCYKFEADSQITRETMSNSLLMNLVNSLQTFTAQGGQTQVQNIISDSQQLSQMVAKLTANYGELDVGPLIGNKSALKEDLDARNVSLSQEAMDALLSSRLLFHSFTSEQLSVLSENASVVLCNETLMQQIIVDAVNSSSSSSSSSSQSVLLAELCEMSFDQAHAQNFVSAVIKNSNSATLAQQFQRIVETGAVKTFTIEDWVRLATLRNRLTANYQHLNTYSYVFDDTMAVVEQYRNISQNFQNSSWVEEIVEILNVLLCARSSTKEQNSLDPSGDSPRFDLLNEQMKKRVETKYEYDPTLSPECNNLFKMFEENPILAGVWKIYKPFIRGKILYAPATNATAPIMRRLNATIYSIKESIILANSSLQLLPLFRTALLDNSIAIEAIKRIADSEIGISLLNNSFVRSTLNGGTKDNDLRGMQDFVRRYLDDSNEANRSRSMEDAQKLIGNLLSYVNCIDFDKIKPYATEEEATSYGMKLLEKNELFAVLVFENQNGEQLTPFVSYKIRMSSDRVDNTEFTRDSRWRPGPRMRPFIDLKYLSMGFGFLQDLIEHYIIAEQTQLPASDLPGLYLQQFPYPCHINDKFIIAISATFPLFMMLSWVYTCAMIVKSIVYEKEERLKETMHVMGLGNGIHWLGWFLDSIAPMMVTCLLLTFILTHGKILRSADPTLVYFFLLIYCVATIAQSFLISVFFSRANLAAASGGIIFFVLYLPYPFMVRWMAILPPYIKAVMCLSSNVAFGVATSYFAFYEEQGTGAQWAEINSSPLYGDKFNLLYVIYLLLFDTCLYLLLTWYIEAIMPGLYGIPKPWYFPFTSSYWCGTTKGVTDINVLRTGSLANENCESEPKSLRQGICIQSLSKVYASNGKVAVTDLSLNFYESQITSFLGHNGAGKTSTISMLTGLFPPSSGTAKIYGLDIRTDMDAIRKSLGMCPQHNVLFNLLTVEEHLWFYARLRGGERGEQQVKAECEAMIVDLGLPQKRACLASHLSGGMQRKLSVAIAFIGGSKTVILDEPTSGVDPYSRRSIWELLTKYKHGRTVVLTTHYMDEADILGDRIAIIAHGKLQCCGSSLYLKNRFGSGYYLTIDIREDKISGGLSSPELTKITHHIKEIVPSASFHEQVGTELVYVLPHSDLEQFKKLFSFLEDFKSELSINSYGISDTSLEEIFLRVGSQSADVPDADDDQRDSRSCFGKLLGLFDNKKNKTRNSCAHRSTVNQPENESFLQVNGSVKYTSVPVVDDGENINPEGNKHWRQFLALHVKRFHHTRRNRKAIFSELVLPGLFVCMALLVTSIVPKLQQRPPLTLAPSVYAPPHYTFTSLNVTSSADNWQADYDASMSGPLGLGTACLSNQHSYDASCAGKSYDYEAGAENVSSFGAPCSCQTGAHLCPPQPNRPVPPSVKMSSHDILFNLTGSNISDWILKTWKQYEKTRMGGFSSGFESPVPIIEFKPGNESDQNPYIDIHYKTNNVKVWFNNKGWASSVSYLNAINNVILRSSLPHDRAPYAHQYGIRAINHPMNFTEKQMNIELIKESGKSLLHAISVLFALSFVPASFLVYLIEDKVSNSKHLQMASGVNRLVYWLQAYVWDMCCYLLSAGLCVFIFLVFNEQNYVSSRNLAGFVILLVFYGWSIIPLMYPASFVFGVPSFAFVGLACANIFIGVITTVTTFVLGVFEDEDLRAVDAVLKEVFLIFPHFCLGDGLMKLAANHIYFFALQQYIDVEVKNEIFKWDYLGKNLLCMFLSGIFYFLLTLVLEFRGFSFLCSSTSSSSTGVHNVLVNADADDSFGSKEDEDVRAERMRINQNQAIDDILVIKNLTKIYSRSKDGGRPAVNQVCAGIKRGECFGLLGLNGAGKTTTFKMLTGALQPTAGDALIGGCSVSRDLDKVRAQLGYCPQFDALDPLLTPREHLVFYARLRNIPSRQLQSVVDASLMKLGLGHYSDRCAGTLSGGNKRKLSTAIAVLGNPPVIFLDEPTSGMDPGARRFLWRCVQRLVREGGHSVVLTSHSMEECQALCTRLTVMVNGQLKCLGSSQHLKNKFGGGYSLSLHCASSEVEGEEEELVGAGGESGVVASVKALISEQLPDARLLEQHHTRLRYQLPPGPASSINRPHPPMPLLAHVFSVMEEARSAGQVLDYSLSQTTLEDVFLQFASEQGEAEEDSQTRHAGRPAIIKNCFKCCSGNSGT